MKNKEHWELYNLYNIMRERDIIVYYKGSFDDATLAKIGRQIQQKVNEDPRNGSKLYAIFMELAHNISQYSAEKNHLDPADKWGIGTIAVYGTEEKYTLLSGNLVLNDVVEPIVKKCQEINKLDREGLRAMKREYRSAEISPGHKGGNIGLIQVALKADFPLEVYTKKLDDNYASLTISATIARHAGSD